jgi:hypothetical protein
MTIIVIVTMYILAALCFVLGVIALMKQKTYIDKETNQPTEVEIPIIGKLKTNYPALVFVVIGGVLAAIPWWKSSPVQVDLGKEEWVLSGTLRSPPGKSVQWESGVLTVLPKGFDCIPNPSGTFEIVGRIQKDKNIEDAVTAINYTNGKFSCNIFIADEYRKFKEGKASLIEEAGNKYRKYKPVVLNAY